MCWQCQALLRRLKRILAHFNTLIWLIGFKIHIALYLFNSIDSIFYLYNVWMTCSTQRAFICNFREHWLTIRRLGQQWFNLNSLLTGPELISDTFLGMFLAQLEGVT